MTDLKYRAALIDRCIEVVRISEWKPPEHDFTCEYSSGFCNGAKHQLDVTIAALELFKAGPKTQKEDQE